MDWPGTETISRGIENDMTKQNGDTVWVVQQYVGTLEIPGNPSVAATYMIGVFLDEREAIAACRDATYMIGPVILGASFPDAPMPWPGAYYPPQKAELST